MISIDESIRIALTNELEELLRKCMIDVLIYGNNDVTAKEAKVKILEAIEESVKRWVAWKIQHVNER